jgi:hypothetical protein
MLVDVLEHPVHPACILGATVAQRHEATLTEGVFLRR